MHQELLWSTKRKAKLERGITTTRAIAAATAFGYCGISATTTTKGLAVRSRLDDRTYPKGRRVSDKQLALVNLEPNAFHGEWNYTIHPTPKNE